MKRIVFFISLLMTAAVISLTSCGDDTTEPTDVTPSMNFKGGTGYTSANASILGGSEFKVGINAFSNAASGAKLVNFTVTRVFNNNPVVVLDSNINLTTFSIDIIAHAQSEVGSETWYYKITDKDNQTNQLSLTITTISSAGPINIFSMKILGAQAAATGSSFASIDGSVYSLSEAKANQAKVDFLYYYGATDKATLAAPDDAHAAEIFTNATNGLQTWTTKNATRFKLVTDTIAWETIEDDQIILQQTATGVNASRIPNLGTGQYISFITASGKSGLIRVENITLENDGAMTLSVKVQK